jgi:hypothetical protein
MDDILIARMQERLHRLRKVAAMAHDQRIVELVSQTADEIEADIHKMETGEEGTVTIHLEPPSE